MTSHLLTPEMIERARRLAQAEEAKRAEEAARLAELARRDVDEGSPPLSPVTCHPEGSEGSRTEPPAAPPATRRKHRLTAAHRAKISRAMKGRKVSAKTRVKLSEAHLGHRLSAETRAKISQALKGKKKSAQTRARMSEARRTHPLSAESRARIGRKVSLALRGERSPTYWHGAYVTPAHPVKSLDDVIEDLSAKQARLSALLDYHLDSGPELTPEVLTLFTLHSQVAGKLGQLYRYKESQQSNSWEEERERAINQALDELRDEKGWEV